METHELFKQIMKDSCLNEGTGDPCAGHERLNETSASVKSMEPFDTPANFGEDPPIGSKNWFYTLAMK